MKIDTSNFKAMLDNCLLSFKNCIENTENSYLFNEIEEDILFIRKELVHIRIFELRNSFKSYHLEVKIKLISASNDEKELGYYTLVLDENNEFIDEFLVFY